ncbi:alkene reductase [Pseudoalteromonas denitrificans]|uniref:N-ethylmaleimide reductase n=1 Tax=Pseudoalteromonas denitrificans DSM 6059 TaxID=1123010 RepID=A0A1I1U7F8_9GAMM|nr:alkene reductase [Pseudoalteromonas denitrificans]SFD66762.1 N-ethylmaleimide reductase [Pseudoalteromonas denitrificans DSM 6059]
MGKLFTELTLGDYHLKNRILMAPLTRCRAVERGIPNALMANYYGQRASAGLIISEAVAVSKQGLGWLNTPGIFTDEQVKGWQKVATSVHEKQGKMFLQLWHMGSIVHPDFLEGQLPVSSSEVKQQGSLTTAKGRDREFVVPRALNKIEIKQVIKQFVDAAKNAIKAGLDGVEIHGANGFLIDQFTRDSINQRVDEYGGSIDNRLRFMMEVVEAVCDAIGSGKVGIRLSPSNSVWGISDSDPKSTFSQAVSRLNAFNLAYVHILESKPQEDKSTEFRAYLTPILRQKYNGKLIINGGFNKSTASSAIHNKEADAVAFGTLFIANPDLVNKFENDLCLTEPDKSTFYTQGAQGYTDY